MTKKKEQTTVRFYKKASIATEGKFYTVRLDGRPVLTPGGNRLCLPTLIMAESIASEWQKQNDKINPLSMPLMQLANTAIDRVTPHREAVIEQIVCYGSADLLCYRAKSPVDLVKAQTFAWQPILDWLADESGVCLKVTSGVMYLNQNKNAMDALYQIVKSFENFPLTILMLFSQSFTSLSLALAVAKGRLNWGDAIDLAFLDETFQAKRWGKDREVVDRLNNIRKEVEQMAIFLNFCED